LVVALVCVATLFTVCSRSSSSNTASSARAEETLRNLGGIHVIIGNWWSDYNVETNVPTNDNAQRTLEWRTRVLKEHNFTMEEKNIASWGETAQLSATSIMAGDPAATVFTLEPSWAMALVRQNLAYPVTDNTAVNLRNPQPVQAGQKAPEWNQATLDAFTINGKAYAFSNGINMSNTLLVFFNKRLFREAGLDPNLPYDMQKAGTWTWAAFIDICKKLTRDTNNDGKMDTYAMAADLSTEILDAIISSNGATYVDKDPKTGKFVNATGRPEFLEALQFAIRLKNEGVLKPRPDGSNWDWYKSEFIDGKVAMRIDESYIAIGDAVELKRMKDDWGMVLFPKGPKSTTYRVYSRDNLMVIPATYKPADVEKIIWAVALWHTPTDDNWKAGQYNYFRDPRAVDETLALVRDPKLAMIKYFSYINGLERGDIAWNMWFLDGKQPAQLIEEVSQDWNTKINEANK